jgi:hypothetical protein
VDASIPSALFLERHLDTLSHYYILGPVSRLQREGGDFDHARKEEEDNREEGHQEEEVNTNAKFNKYSRAG